MNIVVHLLVQVLMAVFSIGVAGCLFVVPIVAYKFASVLFTPEDKATSSPEEPGVAA